jgi:broad specificity phosphatase PhoE
MKLQKLIVIRHAHRDKAMGHDCDNGLSAKGKRQAKLLAKFFSERFAEELEDASVELVSSPKKRCIETIEPVGHMLGIPERVDPLLDEGEDLNVRVKTFIGGLGQCQSELLVVCSHGDWIPLFFERFLGLSIDLKKGAWAEVELDGAERRLAWLVQELESLKL